MTGEIVPFGKYKGQPAEMLAADTGYTEWLLAQPWFREKYGNVYNVLINYGGEPQDSPEHNQMQAQFLEDNWCLKLALRLFPDGLAEHKVSNRAFEVSGWDVRFDVIATDKWEEVPGVTRLGKIRCSVHVECKPDLGDDYPAVLRQVQGYRSDLSSDSRCVVARRHAFESVTWDQVRKIYRASRVLLVAEIEIAEADPVLSLLRSKLGASPVQDGQSGE